MALMSNIKAQASSIYNGIKQTPVAKGLKGMLHEEQLLQKSQREILDKINTESSNKQRAFKGIKEELNDQFGLDRANRNTEIINKVGIDGIKNKNLKKMYSNTDDMTNYKRNTVMNKAGTDHLETQHRNIDESIASSLIEKAAKEVDGQLTVMTPVTMAKRYYGDPLVSSFSNFKNGNASDGMKDLAKGGLRVGATVGATAGAVGLANGVASVTSSAFNRITNSNNGGDR